MITKLLFTIGVILAVYAFVRFRRDREREIRAAQPRPIGPVVEPSPKRSRIGWLATAAVVLMILAGGLLIYQQWRGSIEIIQVRVIDAGTGRAATYKAYRGEIEDRSFRTTDGRRIVLAETERMETAAFTPGQN